MQKVRDVAMVAVTIATIIVALAGAVFTVGGVIGILKVTLFSQAMLDFVTGMALLLVAALIFGAFEDNNGGL